MFIPLSRLCIGGIAATSDVAGHWCWTVEGTQWKFRESAGLNIQVWRQGHWLPVGHAGNLRHAVAFSLGWQSHKDLILSEVVVDLAQEDIGQAVPPAAPPSSP